MSLNIVKSVNGVSGIPIKHKKEIGKLKVVLNQRFKNSASYREADNDLFVTKSKINVCIKQLDESLRRAKKEIEENLKWAKENKPKNPVHAKELEREYFKLLANFDNFVFQFRSVMEVIARLIKTILYGKIGGITLSPYFSEQKNQFIKNIGKKELDDEYARYLLSRTDWYENLRTIITEIKHRTAAIMWLADGDFYLSLKYLDKKENKIKEIVTRVEDLRTELIENFNYFFEYFIIRFEELTR